MIVTTGAVTCGYNYCVELHWHLSFHKFDVKNFSDWKKKHSSFDMKSIARVYRIIAWPICNQCLNLLDKILMSVCACYLKGSPKYKAYCDSPVPCTLFFVLGALMNMAIIIIITLIDCMGLWTKYLQKLVTTVCLHFSLVIWGGGGLLALLYSVYCLGAYTLTKWQDNWQMTFNTDKCLTLKVSCSKTPKQHKYNLLSNRTLWDQLSLIPRNWAFSGS